MRLELKDNKCICGNDDYTSLYPQRIDWMTFSSYEFSSRRERRIQHYRIVRCNNCGLVRSNPVFSEEDLFLLYKECKFLDKNESQLAAETYASLLSGYLKLLADRGSIKLLEIGCGNGVFLQEMRKYNINRVVGVEPSKDALKYASDGIKSNIINNIFEFGYFESETFDILCAFHALDHLFNPDKFIKESYRIIKKGGIILLVCHNVDAIINKILREHSPIFDIGHIFLFNKVTLRNLIETNGFTLVGIGDLKNKYQVSYWLRYAPLLNKLVKLLPGYIKSYKLALKAGNIFVCAQKK